MVEDASISQEENIENLDKKSMQVAISKLEFEDALTKLQNISKKLDSGNISLSYTIKYLEYATVLKSHCKKILENFKLKVEEIISSEEDTKDNR
ncbi:MAG: exodeoxyribonuclease VII small subunit [Rickettsia sp.]|nr:exodeoxyribonuclease VII small subunit [Rickettsia sp.]